MPAWGAVAIAAGLTFLGFLVDAARGTELTGAFAFLYILGCIAAVVLVRYRGLFTAMVQAPLILFVAVPLSYQYFTDNAGTSLKDIILNVAIPLVNRFPLMLLGTLVAVGLGVVRIFLKRQNTHAPAVRRGPKPSDAKPTRAQRRAQEDRPERTRTRRPTADADRSAPSDAEATDIVPGPYVGRRSTDSQSRGSRPGITPETGARRQSVPTPSAPTRSRAAATDFARGEHSKPDYQTPENQRTRYRPPTPEARPSTDTRYSTEPRRERSTRIQPPREVADPFGTGARPVVPRSSVSGTEPDSNSQGSHSLPTSNRDDIPPHPVPQVRYRDRHSD
ncbi:hypothetical protein CH275_26205 [Rhodococcus sp. 06-235-1A]|nr:hypothetical protein CH275_26205 [Rhodococcus sp. 06-235-1A]